MARDEATDEIASYFNRETQPKILITTTDRPTSVRIAIVFSFNLFYMEARVISSPLNDVDDAKETSNINLSCIMPHVFGKVTLGYLTRYMYCNII